MKRSKNRLLTLLLVLAVIPMMLTLNLSVYADEGADGGGIPINESNFPDQVFRSHVADNFDTDRDGTLSSAEAIAVKDVRVSEKGIADLKGIEYFPKMRSLYCYKNQLTSLDVSKNSALTSLSCSNNQLTSLDVSKNSALVDFGCSNNQLTSLDVSKNSALASLACFGNQLTSLDVSKNTLLAQFHCSDNQLSSLDLSKNVELWAFTCENCQLHSLDVSKNPKLLYLHCFDNQITSLDLSKNPLLEALWCENNQLTSLDVSKNPVLGSLHCYNNQLVSLDVSSNPNLLYLYCSNNHLNTLDVSSNPNLEAFTCFSNQLTFLDVSHNPKLTDRLSCSDDCLLDVIGLQEGISSFDALSQTVFIPTHPAPDTPGSYVSDATYSFDVAHTIALDSGASFDAVTGKFVATSLGVPIAFTTALDTGHQVSGTITFTGQAPAPSPPAPPSPEQPTPPAPPSPEPPTPPVPTPTTPVPTPNTPNAPATPPTPTVPVPTMSPVSTSPAPSASTTSATPAVEASRNSTFVSVAPASVPEPEPSVESARSDTADKKSATISEAPASLTPTPGDTGSWALLNLLLVLATLAVAAYSLFRCLAAGRRDGDSVLQGQEQKINPLWFALECAVTATGILVFVLTEDLAAPMVVVDAFTVVQALMGGMAVLLYLLAFKSSVDATPSPS